MKASDYTFRLTPSVVMADRVSEVSLTANGGVFELFDDTEYEITVIPTDKSDVGDDDSLKLHGIDKKRKPIVCRPMGGVLKFQYFFSGETQWSIRIRALDYSLHENPAHVEAAPHYDSVRARPMNGTVLAMYSLYPDLYERMPLRGDLHVHTNFSDGDESPAFTAAAYRRAGYDFIAVTDHAQYDVGAVARSALDMNTGFRVLVGEEIHNAHDGQIHLISIGARAGVSRIFMKEQKRVQAEVKALSKTVKVPSGLPKKEYLYRLWAYKTAKSLGGLVIYPHPYWNLKKCRWHVGPELASAILEGGLCDAFELMGGGNTAENNLQTALYYDSVSKGLKLPVVGSTDNHSVMGDFATASTLVFAKDDGDVAEAVLSNHTLALDHKAGQIPRLFGPFRLVRYAYFLINHFYPVYSDLCSSAGTLMLEYLRADGELKPLIEMLEEKIMRYRREFFGKKQG